MLHDLSLDQPDLADTFVNLVGVDVLVGMRHSQLRGAGVLLFPLYEALVFPPPERDGLRWFAYSCHDLRYASGA